MNITIIGSGNVATHLAAAFKNAGHHIVQVYSPNFDHAALLAYHVKAMPVSSMDDITDTGLFVISVKDDAIEAVARQLARHQKPVVHTSGATPLSAIAQHTLKAGVFYPLQTFSKVREVDFRSVPLCIEATDAALERILMDLAQTVSNNVSLVNSAQRKQLHLAAVFAGNFPNYLYGIAHHLTASFGLDFNLLQPLILETAAKVQERMPEEVQTGPAIRNDEATMDAHLKLLEQQPYYRQVYKLLSRGIMKKG